MRTIQDPYDKRECSQDISQLVVLFFETDHPPFYLSCYRILLQLGSQSSPPRCYEDNF
jgi:hypothetical protein